MVSLSLNSPQGAPGDDTGGLQASESPIQEQVNRFCDGICRALTPILARPTSRAPTAPTRRPQRKRTPVSNPRRSAHLARGVGKGSAVSKQQRVLMRRLCLANECEEISDETLLMYAELFSKKLTSEQIAAILALFGWDASILPM